MSKEKFVRDKPHVNIGVLIAVFGILSGLSLGMVIFNDVVATLDSDGDTIPDLEEDRAKQPLFFDITGEVLTFRSYGTETIPTTGNHEVGHNLDISHAGVSSHLEIHSRLYDDVSTEIPLLDFGVKYESLIEFVDFDANGFFEPAVDVIIAQTTLDNITRTEFGYGIDGQPSYYSKYSTLGGVFKVNLYTSREHVLLARQVGLLAPNELKSYLTFTNYVLLTPGTNLALKLSLNATHNLIFSNTGLSVKTSTGEYTVEYEWYDRAITDGTTTLVNTTVPKSSVPSKSGVIYVNFGELTNASYDPKLSWSVPIPGKWNIADLPWTYFAIGSIALLMVVSTTRILRKKPGRVKYVYAKSSDSTKTTSKTEKRIPSHLRHKDR
ncbi:MAG: hypothetical protein ACTSO6_12795 [Promethearchaeota archaeon]